MIEIKQIKKKFHQTSILKGVDLTIQKGEVKVIIGPSGSGKTTFLRCINCLESAESGEILLKGKKIDFSNLSKKERLFLGRHTSMVFQHYNLFRNKTALQNITEGLIMVKKTKKDEAVAIAEVLLTQIGLLEQKDKYPSQLSGGQQQRIGIARALALNPEIVLFDEPTSALDPELVGEILAIIRTLAQDNRTMLIVTHEMSFAKEIADEVIFMEDGQVIAKGTPKQIFEESTNERVNRFLTRVSNQ